MAQQALFDKYDISGNNTSSAKEAWYDLCTIPSGKKLWIGFGSFFPWDKTMTFELRGNKPGQSVGTLAATDRIDVAGAPTQNPALMDVFKNGNVAQKTAPMSALSTGVEKLWLRVVSNTNAAGAFDYQLDYCELTE